MASTVQSIESNLQGRIAELKAEEERLESALTALRGIGTIPTVKPVKTIKPVKTTIKTVKPVKTIKPVKSVKSNGQPEDGQIVKAIHANGEPASIGQIREALGVGKGTVLPRKLKAMVEAGTLQQQGQRRATRYTPA